MGKLGPCVTGSHQIVLGCGTGETKLVLQELMVLGWSDLNETTEAMVMIRSWVFYQVPLFEILQGK
jgi:hypothetical protein